MFGEMRVDLRDAFGNLLHEKNAAARRVRFDAEKSVGGARLLAHAAARAKVEIRKSWLLLARVTTESRYRHEPEPGTPRVGSKTLRESSARRMRA